MIIDDKIDKYLTEKVTKNKNWNDTVRKAAALADWSSVGIAEFVYDLMIECNFSSDAKDISYKISKL